MVGDLVMIWLATVDSNAGCCICGLYTRRDFVEGWRREDVCRSSEGLAAVNSDVGLCTGGLVTL